jgi:hypothetical protein
VHVHQPQRRELQRKEKRFRVRLLNQSSVPDLAKLDLS